MASGHVNRANRPNTWLHRLRLQREDSPCQLGAVHTWHKADILIRLENVRSRGNSGHEGCEGETFTGLCVSYHAT